jgi:hypothetical protein
MGGELISLALVGERGSFYQVLGCKNPMPWVAQNVMPRLDLEPIERKKFVLLLHRFLLTYPDGYGNLEIVADWPEDLRHFCECLVTGPGEALNMPLTMRLIGEINIFPLRPHNALSDADALYVACEGKK